MSPDPESTIPQDDANLTAIALVHDAIEHSLNGTDGKVMDRLVPYLTKQYEQAGSPDGGIDIAPALSRVIACLAQFAGVLFYSSLAAREGKDPGLEAVLAGLDEFELSYLSPPDGS